MHCHRNSELRHKLADANSDELTFDPELVGPTDTMPMRIKRGDEERVFEIEIGAIFVAAYDEILAEQQEANMSYHLGQAASGVMGIAPSAQGTQMHKGDVISLRNQLAALGLLEPLSKRTAQGTPYIVWSPTPKGRKYASMRKAIRRDSSA